MRCVKLSLLCLLLAPLTLADEPRPHLRDLGVEPGVLEPGPHNAITDVEGVRVGHRTLVKGEAVRTGVTAVLPHGGNVFQEKVPAAVYVGNGFGKAAGFLQVQELGQIETPIVLTHTLAVGTAVQAVVDWTLRQPGNEDVYSVNAVVGETNDGYLNDIRGGHVTAKDVVVAIESATTGPVDEGSVGAGTGTRALGFKGGIGTSSRKLPKGFGGWTVGVLVQSNFGGILSVDGVPVGELWGMVPYRQSREEGSVMIVVATDAPLSSRNLERLAKRAILGVARTGSYMSNGSGDFVIAFSTAQRIPYGPSEATQTVERVHNDALSPLFLAVVEATEEAILSSLVRATTVTGRDGHRAEAIPLDRLRDALKASSHSTRTTPNP